PMVVGLVDPVVLLPVGYGDGMTDTEIESVAVHELEHVVRRDNLDAATVDLIASIFWFDPFHWIARGRLLELREGACDERVLASGLPPNAYLSALAKTSHAAITTPAVACMSGFRVRERMESIMSYTTHQSHWISEGIVRAFGLVVLGVFALAIAGFAPVIADDHDASPRSAEVSMGQHIVNIATYPDPGGKILIEAEIRTADGTLVSAPRITALAGEPVEISTKVGGKQYKLSITAAADGSGFAKLEVLEGETVVDTIVKSISAPAFKMRSAAEPVTITLNDADLDDFLAVMRKLTGKQIILAGSPKGKVTIDVRDTPWDQALARAIAPLGLRAEIKGDRIEIVEGPPLESKMRAPLQEIREDLRGPAPEGYERVGDDVKAPKVITRIDPKYPEEARAERASGIVIVEALIGTDGAVKDVKPLKWLPFGLTEAAVDAVRQWTFEPATKNGVPVPVAFSVTINFKLDGGEKTGP
ncbi:MAG TPA: TonB family protein, partial [Thermoanaerobaculia bacterium]|nr:TonB family protein [Thermoanaerobaculia bacterium]